MKIISPPSQSVRLNQYTRQLIGPLPIKLVITIAHVSWRKYVAWLLLLSALSAGYLSLLVDEDADRMRGALLARVTGNQFIGMLLKRGFLRGDATSAGSCNRIRSAIPAQEADAVYLHL